MQSSGLVIGAWDASGTRFLRFAWNPDSAEGDETVVLLWPELSVGTQGQWGPRQCICFGDYFCVFSGKGIRSA